MHHRQHGSSIAPHSPVVFDSLASVYESDRNREFYGVAARLLVDRATETFVVSAFRDDACCLDLACGTGISTEIAVRAAPDARWHGLDASAKMLAVAAAKESLASVRWIESAAERTPLPDATYDWILCNIAYHWLSPVVVNEIQRLLKPHGRLSLVVPLLPTSARLSGNRWIRRGLRRCSRFVRARRSQGLTLETLQSEMQPLRLRRVETIRHIEHFPSPVALTESLASRGSLHAIFGDRAEQARLQLMGVEVDQQEGGALQFQWDFALIEAENA